MPRSMHTCQVSVSRTVSGRELVGTDGTVPDPRPGPVLNSGQQRLGTGMRDFRLEVGNAWRQGTEIAP